MQNWDMGRNQICQLKHLAGGSCFPLAHSWSDSLLGFFKGLLILRLFHLQLGRLGEDKSSPLLGAHTGCASAALLHLTIPQELGLAAIKLATGKKRGRGEFFCCVILLTQLIWTITLLRQTSVYTGAETGGQSGGLRQIHIASQEILTLNTVFFSHQTTCRLVLSAFWCSSTERGICLANSQSLLLIKGCGLQRKTTKVLLAQHKSLASTKPQSFVTFTESF